MSENLSFRNLKVSDWRQFKNVSIDFHPSLTVITGANGAGKSSLLSILGQQFGWSKSFLALPKKQKGTSAYRYFTGLGEENDEDDTEKAVPSRVGQMANIGSLTYSNNVTAAIKVPAEGAQAYAIQLENIQPVVGLLVTPVQLARQYQRVQNIPSEPMMPELAFQQWIQLKMQAYFGNYTPDSPSVKMKQALISMAMFGPGNVNSTALPEVEKAFNGFNDILRKVLPRPIGFQKLSVRTPDIVVETDSGKWLIDEASGGVSALIELAWQIFLFSVDKRKFVVLLDEPENHLHPSMQRRILPNLIAAFPQVQFIVATHSPFIVSAVRESAVYVLHYNLSMQEETVDETASEITSSPIAPESEFFQSGHKRSVVSTKLDLVAKSGTASEVLKDVLGVPVTTPDWVAEDIQKIVMRYRELPFTNESVGALREELDRLGMGDRFPEALASVAENP